MTPPPESSRPPVEGSRLRSPAAFAIATVMVVAVGGWLAVGSPIFEVDRIVVRGVRHLDADHVRSLARLPRDANLLRLSLAEIAARVEGDPWVAAATATRDLPSTLVVEVRERRASGWLDAGGTAVVVAGDGTVLERRAAPPTAVPRLEGAAGPELESRVDEALPSLRVSGSMPGGLLARVRTVGEEGDEIVALLRGGGEVRYGLPTQLGEKHRAVVSILSWASDRDVAVTVVDVRAPSAPTLRAPGGAVAVPSDAIPTPPD